MKVYRSNSGVHHMTIERLAPNQIQRRIELY